ncbi:MAG: phosphatidate cytidylyltransferase [Prevotellaceae bacterium]|jgi:phosphatidate cytidylyltransferase|nr:phosphatidate cytidylyltransferase [Prevotellaceae bacterium]
MKLNNLLVRSLSGAVFVALILAPLCLRCPSAFAVVMLAAMLVSMVELYRIAQQLSAQPQRTAGLAGGVLLFAACYAHSFGLLGQPYDQALLYLMAPMSAFIFFAELFRKKSAPFTNIAYTILGVVYVALPFSLMSVVYAAAGASVMCCFFLLLWANDTFAYLFGMTFGKRRLFPSISPKKSWEGCVGGFLSVLALAYGLHRLLDVALVHLLCLGVIISATAVLSDLVESMLKRSANLKDSGAIMPGHGGLLDRFDAALLSLPVVWAYVHVFML